MSRSLIVLPDDTAKPILDAINGATKVAPGQDVPLLRSRTSESRDRRQEARRQGPHHAESSRRSGKAENKQSRKQLKAGDVEVIDSNPDYDVTHEKSMVVDDTTAFVKSLNWETKNLTETRDYAIVTTHAHEVAKSSNASKPTGTARNSRPTKTPT